jgi:hypothetical protein
MYEQAALPKYDSDLPENEWPCMELKDVSVYQGRELVDLFDISENGPFQVRGKLSQLKGKMKGLGKLRRRVTRFLMRSEEKELSDLLTFVPLHRKVAGCLHQRVDHPTSLDVRDRND